MSSSPIVSFEGREIALRDKETVLEALEREGVPVMSSCRAGVCQSCLMQATDGQLPPKAQQPLKESLRAQGYFLACVCVPEGNLSVALPGAGLEHEATVLESEDIGAAVRRVRLTIPDGLDWFAGQYITVIRDALIARSYSIASGPSDGYLELHVRRIPGGLVSNWLHDVVRPGDTLRFRGVFGDCFYTPGDEEAPLVLAGTGTGLAPLYGIIREALRHNHRGPITLYHGAVDESGLYLRTELSALAGEGHIDYRPSVINGEDTGEGFLTIGLLDEVVLGANLDLKRTRAYLCGDPALVEKMRKKLFIKGLSSRRIFADAFVPTARP
jgi:CDP-4-dehydro-6-deoxyglucose reductase